MLYIFLILLFLLFNHSMSTIILGIESSCDDTSAAILQDHKILANVIANQHIHKEYGGVVPELASRAHQQNIIPVIHAALEKANIHKNQLNAIAFTQGPGLLGSLLVGVSFAKSFALGLGIPLVEVDHMQGHIMAHFIEGANNQLKPPPFPFLCLTISGGHTQIVVVKSPFDFDIIGQTIDDAAGEAFDKAAKIMGLPYPGGPLIDKYAQEGEAIYPFPQPKIGGLDFSFSGLKTSFLYFLRDRLKEDDQFIEKNKAPISASIQQAIIAVLVKKVELAIKQTGITHLAIAGGVSANSGLRNTLLSLGEQKGYTIYAPKFEFCTDNAAMIAMTGYFKYKAGVFSNQQSTPYTRQRI